MNHRKLIPLWIAMVVGLTLSCRKVPQEPVEPPEVEWFQTYGSEYDEWGGVARRTSDGGYIIVGTSDSFPVLNRNMYLIKTDKDGNMMWFKEHGMKYSNEKGNSVQPTSDGGYIIAGEREKRDNIGLRCRSNYLVKTDSLGDTLWTKEFQGHRIDQAISVIQTKDGGYVVLGSKLIKVDAEGNEVWEKSYEGYDIQETSESGFIMVGRTPNQRSGRWIYPDLYLARIDESGDLLWEKTYGGRYGEEAFSIQQTTDGGYIIVGEKDPYGGGVFDVYLLKTDKNGDTLWTKTYGGEDVDVGNSVTQTSDGGYIIAGWTDSFDAIAGDIYLIKTDDQGDTLWTYVYGGRSNDIGYTALETSDGGYIIAGHSVSFGAGGADIFLMKLK